MLTKTGKEMKFNYTNVKAHLKLIGISLTHHKDTREYIINYINGHPDKAYFTNDLQDALDTGVNYAKRDTITL